MRFAPLSYESILQQLIARMVALTPLSDVNDSSVLLHLAAGIARAVDQNNYNAACLLSVFDIDQASGADLDKRAQEIQPGTITRLPANSAVGAVVFSRNATTGVVYIPQGTQIEDASGNAFETSAAGEIADNSPAQITGHSVGQDSAPVAIVAVLAGSAGNVAANTLTQFAQVPTGVNSATNLSATTQGSDQESDDQFRARIKGYVASLPRSTETALTNAVLGARDPATGDQILFSQCVEDLAVPGFVTLFVDDGSGQAESVQSVSAENVTYGLSGPPANSAVGGETRLQLQNAPVKDADAITLTSSTRGALERDTQYTLNSASGLLVMTPALSAGENITASYTYYTGIIALAQKIVDGDPEDRTDYPGVRAAGVQVTCQSPLVVAQPISIQLTTADGYDADATRLSVQNAVLNYINALSIGDDILRASLFAQIMAQAGVTNAVLSAPTADVTIHDGQIARCLAANVTVN
ncbi:MAG: baseplate J/gp47 family protein [Janthinobacterium lividum]